jgi:MFS family permease
VVVSRRRRAAPPTPTAQPASALQAGFPAGVFSLICLAAFAEFLGVGITIIALPRFVADDLHRGDLSVGFAVGVFAVGALSVRPWAGVWGDRFGRRVLLLAGAVVTAVPLAATALVDTYAALIALRIAAGVGQALFFVGGATLAADLAPEHRRGEALSLFSLPIYVGLGLGPLLGERLSAAHGPHFAFAVAGLIPLAGLVLGAFLREPPRARAGPTPAAGRARLVHPAAIGPGSVMLLGLAGFIGFQAYLPLYASDIGLAQPGLVFLMYSGIVLMVRLAGARLPDRLGAGRAGTVATCAIATGLGGIAAFPFPLAVFLGTAVLAVGMALQYPALMSLAIGRAPDTERARVVSTFGGFFDLAQACGGGLLGILAAGLGYRAAFAGGALAAILALAMLRLHVARPDGRRVRVETEPEVWAPAGAD